MGKKIGKKRNKTFNSPLIFSIEKPEEKYYGPLL